MLLQWVAAKKKKQRGAGSGKGERITTYTIRVMLCMHIGVYMYSFIFVCIHLCMRQFVGVVSLQTLLQLLLQFALCETPCTQQTLVQVNSNGILIGGSLCNSRGNSSCICL